jgi:hypothetical protein
MMLLEEGDLRLIPGASTPGVFFLAREDAVGTPYSVPPLALTKKNSSDKIILAKLANDM